MNQKSSRVPHIRSEIAVALAFLGWSMRQLMDYSVLMGYPVSERFLEDALVDNWVDFRTKGDSCAVEVEHLTWVLASLGIGLRDDVFGIVRINETRIPQTNGASQTTLLLALAGNYPEANLRLAIQEPSSGEASPVPALLVDLGNRFLLCDHMKIEAADLVGGLYANCLARLSVAESRIPSLSALAEKDAVTHLLHTTYRAALHLSKARVLSLLNKDG